MGNFFNVLLISLFVLLYSCDKKQAVQGVTNKVNIRTLPVTSISADSAIGSGEITSSGNDVLTERGVCWSVNQNPKASDKKISSGSGIGSFTVKMKDLLPNTQYYLRAYSISDQGEVYGNQVNFKTQSRVPSLSTVQATSITGYAFTSGGIIQSDGGSSIIERGICWSSTNVLPTINDSKLSSNSTNSTYAVTVQNLVANTIYWIRSFARNSAGTGYGAAMSIKTGIPELPILTAVSISNILQKSTQSTATIVSTGGIPISQHGVCLSTQSSMLPRVCTWIMGNQSGVFNLAHLNLQAGTTYYAKAYAINAVGEGSSPTITTFATLPPTLPSVINSSVSNVTYISAVLQGNVIDDGASTIIERGFYISTGAGSIPTTSSTRLIATNSGTGVYTVSATGLNPGMTYNFRAYARNSVGVTLSSSTLSFNTLQSLPPTLTTGIASNISSDGFSVGGSISSDGGSAVTVRGVVWSLNPNPIVSVNNTVAASGSGIGSFTVQLSGLPSDRTVYYRTYATNSFGVSAYGTPERNAITLLSTPILLSPANSTTVGCCTINFDWNTISGASSYEIQVSRNQLFSGTIFTLSTCGSSSRPSISQVNALTTSLSSACINSPTSSGNGTWYWRVRARSLTNISNWSSVNSFRFTW